MGHCQNCFVINYTPAPLTNMIKIHAILLLSLLVTASIANPRIKRAPRECDLDPKHQKISYFDVIYRYGRPFLMNCLMKKQGFDKRDCKQWSCEWDGSWMYFHAWC